MQNFLVISFILLSAGSFWLFLKGQLKLSPLWIMLSAWFMSIGISALSLSEIELPWPSKYWYLIFLSLISFILGVVVFNKVWIKYPWWQKVKTLVNENFSQEKLTVVIYGLFIISLGGLYMFFQRVGNFPILAPDPDEFRFMADTQVPGLINYCSQLARVFIPLSFFLMFIHGFAWKKHWHLIILCIIGAGTLILFASRTQIFFIDLWVMALYLFIRKPNWRQAVKFYPFFLLVSVVVLAAVPMIRQYRSYGDGYLAGITGVDASGYNVAQKAFLPIYIGVSFNQQALLHAWQYYQVNPIQHGRVSLDPFTNILGLDQYKSSYDLGEIFYSWWNTGTYLFPFVQDFGESAFYFIPFLIAGILTLLWRYWQSNPNFFSINLYAYAMFFIVMTVYLSFTVRAEMYIDLFLLFMIYLFISRKYVSQDH